MFRSYRRPVKTYPIHKQGWERESVCHRFLVVASHVNCVCTTACKVHRNYIMCIVRAAYMCEASVVCHNCGFSRFRWIAHFAGCFYYFALFTCVRLGVLILQWRQRAQCWCGSGAAATPTHFETIRWTRIVLPSFSLFNGHRPHKKRIYCIIKWCIYITVQFAHQVVNENRRFYVVTQMLRTHIWVFRFAPPLSS